MQITLVQFVSPTNTRVRIISDQLRIEFRLLAVTCSRIFLPAAKFRCSRASPIDTVVRKQKKPKTKRVSAVSMSTSRADSFYATRKILTLEKGLRQSGVAGITSPGGEGRQQVQLGQKLFDVYATTSLTNERRVAGCIHFNYIGSKYMCFCQQTTGVWTSIFKCCEMGLKQCLICTINQL